MDRAIRDITIKALLEHLNYCRVQFASLDNGPEKRREMAEARDSIQLLLDLMDREQKKSRYDAGRAVRSRPSPFE